MNAEYMKSKFICTAIRDGNLNNVKMSIKLPFFFFNNLVKYNQPIDYSKVH